MRYPASEKIEIIRLVEQSALSARKTLDRLGVPSHPSRARMCKYHPGTFPLFIPKACAKSAKMPKGLPPIRGWQNPPAPEELTHAFRSPMTSPISTE